MKRAGLMLSLALVMATLLAPPVLAVDPPAPAGDRPADAEVLQAIASGRGADLRQLLKRGGNARAQTTQGTPAIAVAMNANSLDALAALLEADPALANETFKDSRAVSRSILAGAVLLKHPPLVGALIQAGADVQWVDGDERSLLALAVLSGDLASVRLLVDAKADPNRRDIYGHSPLSIAALNGNLDAARLLLDHGAWPYPLDSGGNSALSLARSRIKDPATSTAMVELLLAHGAPANGENRPLDDSYVEAVRRGDAAAVEDALAKGADINARRVANLESGLSEVVSLAVHYPKLLVYLLDHGADMYACTEYGDGALHVAAGRDGTRESVEILVKRGLDINRLNRFKQPPLYDAVNQNLPSTVELLLKLGARATTGPGEVDLVDMARKPNHSALIAPMLEKAGATASPAGAPAACTLTTSSVPACAIPGVIEIGNVALVKKGIEGGASIDGRDERGRPLLSLSLLLPAHNTNLGIVVTDDESIKGKVARRKAIAQYLLNNGADVSAADTAGFTALHVAAGDSRLTEFVAQLVKKKAPLDAVGGPTHLTALMIAIDAKNPATAELLLEAGADPNIPMGKGNSPLMTAAFTGQAALAALLIKKGAKIEAVSETGLTALKAAVFQGQNEAVALLLKSGANADFDGGVPPSPRAMSLKQSSALQGLFPPLGAGR